LNRFVEIRSYNLRPGTRDRFHRLVVEQSVPMLNRWDVDVVLFGPSPHDQGLVLSDARLHQPGGTPAQSGRFYASDEWRHGPRQALVDCIESDTSVVLEMDLSTIASLRRATGA